MTTQRNQDQSAMDMAPGKELIFEYLATGEFVVLQRYFQVRMQWCGGYPLVHDRFVSYGAFDDLLSAIATANRYTLIPLLLQMAESVKDSHFHGALSLLSQAIPDDRIGPRPFGFSDGFLRLRIRAERLSFLPNLECTWDSLALKQRYLLSSDDPLRKYTARQLGLTRRWTEFFPSPLLNYRKLGMKECDADLAALRKTIQEAGCLPGQRRLIYVTRIEDSRYWVWKLPSQTASAHLHRILYLRQPPNGPIGVGHWDIYRQFSERDSPDQISRRLMQIEFSELNYDQAVRRRRCETTESL